MGRKALTSATLEAFKPTKNMSEKAAPLTVLPQAPARTKPRPGQSKDGRVGLTLRLRPEAWKTLKVLAVTEEVTVHDLLIEAVNMLFTKRHEPPIA